MKEREGTIMFVKSVNNRIINLDLAEAIFISSDGNDSTVVAKMTGNPSGQITTLARSRDSAEIMSYFDELTEKLTQ